MSITKIQFSGKKIENDTSPLIVFVVGMSAKKKPIGDAAIKKSLGKLSRLGDFSGKKDETLLFYPPAHESTSLRAERVLLCGIGEIENKEDKQVLAERLRSAGGSIAKQAGKVKSSKISIVVPGFLGESPHTMLKPLLEGVLLGDYRFAAYKKEDKQNPPFPGIGQLTLYQVKKTAAVSKAIAEARNGADSACQARSMANEPGNIWTPQKFADFAEELAGQYGFTCTVLDKKQIKQAGMGGIIAVNQGSTTPPKLVILDYRPESFKKTILIVGKGITFDSGGISIKPAAGMHEMKYDMCGGAAVLSTMIAVGREKPKLRVVCIVPTTDNMSGGGAIKPGDVITHYNGVTGEILNTDAEGRLILADALAYGIEQYEPDGVIDLATLTGAVIIGLGHHRAGLMSNHDGWAETVLRAGEKTGERLWRLPLGEEYSKQIESDVADIKNIGGKGAGTITAAAYLQNFVGDTPWVHLDIAGTAWEYTEKTYIPKGPSGIGVRLLLEIIRDWKNTLP
jgi:leucyl aminopeptidase